MRVVKIPLRNATRANAEHGWLAMAAGSTVWAITHKQRYFWAAYTSEHAAKYICDKIDANNQQVFEVNFRKSPDYLIVSGFKPELTEA